MRVCFEFISPVSGEKYGLKDCLERFKVRENFRVLHLNTEFSPSKCDKNIGGHISFTFETVPDSSDSVNYRLEGIIPLHCTDHNCSCNNKFISNAAMKLLPVVATAWLEDDWAFITDSDTIRWEWCFEDCEENREVWEIQNLILDIIKEVLQASCLKELLHQ